MHDHGHHHDHHHHHHHGHEHHHHHGHNGAPDDHLHSHIHGASDHDRAEELKLLTASLVDSFRKAEDKTSFLRLAGIPFHEQGSDGCKLHLVDVQITTSWQIGTASPAFASKELAYLPFPGELARERETMMFTYVSMSERRDVDLIDIIAARFSKD